MFLKSILTSLVLALSLTAFAEGDGGWGGSMDAHEINTWKQILYIGVSKGECKTSQVKVLSKELVPTEFSEYVTGLDVIVNGDHAEFFPEFSLNELQCIQQTFKPSLYQ